MKVIVNKDVIFNVMKKASKIANGRSLLQIYNHVAVYFNGEYCTITASDGTRSYSETFEATGTPGNCALESVKLNRAISGMKKGDIEITSSGVKQGKTNIKLENMNYDAFPLADFDNVVSSGIDNIELVSICSTIGHAMPTKDVRMMLNGVHLTKGKAVATDGHRMAFVESGYSGEDIIIPADTVRNIPDIDGEIFASDKKLVIIGQTCKFSTALVDAKYPDWQKIIPKNHEIELEVSKEEITNALKTVQIGGEMVKLKITKSAINFKNDGAETECECKSNGDIEIGFMIQYLLDAINQSFESNIIIKLGSGKACLINENFVVMPVRL